MNETVYKSDTMSIKLEKVVYNRKPVFFQQPKWKWVAWDYDYDGWAEDDAIVYRSDRVAEYPGGPFLGHFPGLYARS